MVHRPDARRFRHAVHIVVESFDHDIDHGTAADAFEQGGLVPVSHLFFLSLVFWFSRGRGLIDHLLVDPPVFKRREVRCCADAALHRQVDKAVIDG